MIGISRPRKLESIQHFVAGRQQADTHYKSPADSTSSFNSDRLFFQLSLSTAQVGARQCDVKCIL